MPGRLLTAAALSALLATGCAGADGSDRGLIRENVIEPGITAIGEARESACGINAQTLQTAIEAYTLLVGEAPPTEATLVEEGYLREETSDWDVIDGRLVAENPTCGEVPASGQASPPVDMTPTVDSLMSALTSDDIQRFGGERCAREYVIAAAALAAYEADNLEPPAGSDVAANGYLSQPLSLWLIVGDQIRPTNASPCSGGTG